MAWHPRCFDARRTARPRGAEFHKMFEALAAPKAAADGRKPQAFHVVAPSLPGYGFSSAPRQPGFGIRKIAATFDALMSALGYQTYVAQGAPRRMR
jgi:pimeloyl-ACP methyl ester carboxylesterase